MARSVNAEDPYLSSLLKYIPTEIVGAYLAVQGIIAAARPDPALQALAVLIASIVLFVATPFYLWRVQSVTGIAQIVLSTLSFVVWVYTLGGPFVAWELYDPLIGSILLVLWSVIIPLLAKPKPAAA